MVTLKKFKEIAMSFPETIEAPHFENKAYKVGKKIFATLNEKENRCCLKFNEIDQDVFCSFDKTIIYPVPNKWGKHGWTNIQLDKVEEEMLFDALTTAFCEIAPARLTTKYKLE